MSEQNESNVDSVKRYFENKSARQRVQKDIVRAREEATVTIGRAAELFGYTEHQLRDWESRGLLHPRRSKDNRGQRLYPVTELDKLAMLKELIDEGGYGVGSIPPELEVIWRTAIMPSEHYKSERTSHLSIDRHVEQGTKEDFWHYYVSQTLRIALNVIFEDLSETIAGILLPIARKENATATWESDELVKLGPCLIGWRDQDSTFHTFYEVSPSFEFPSDFRVRGLQWDGENEPLAGRTFVVIQRRVRALSLPTEVVEVVRLLLKPVYDDVEKWLPFFKDGSRHTIKATTVLRGMNSADSLLSFLADKVIQSGGKNNEGADRWKFCCILLPENPTAPLQMQRLVVQAQSEHSPHMVDETTVSPDATVLSLSLRAYQSGHVMFRSPISDEDTTIALRADEAPVQSVTVLPIGGENGVPLGVLYIASNEPLAFERKYQRMLRFMSRIIGELLALVVVRKQSEERLLDIVEQPRTINRVLGSFSSENKFVRDIEELLTSLQEKESFTAQNTSLSEDAISFISIDVDNLSRIVQTYGNQIITNLSRAVGDRIQSQIAARFSKFGDSQLYHAYADRFYLILKNRTLEQARESARILQRVLQEKYYVAVLPFSVEQQTEKVEINNVTVRLGVTSYKHDKLRRILARYMPETRVADTRALIMHFLDVALSMGRGLGGGVIVSWDYTDPPACENGRFIVLPPRAQRAEV